MRKLAPVIITLLLVSIASATTIESENVKIDLENSKVNAEIKVEELTSSKFTYISSKSISSVNASIKDKKLSCDVSDLPLGSEIECDTNKTGNFTINLSYKAENLVEEKENVDIFQYSHQIYRPTNRYSLEVLLPRGKGLIEKSNSSQQVISPLNYDTGSNGRRIWVKWDQKPELGESLSFYILFKGVDSKQEDPDKSPSYELIIQAAAALSVLIIVLLILYRRLQRENLSNAYGDLSSDEQDVIDIIKENEGEYLQKDIVEDMDYSKAKVSDIISQLVEKDLLEKSKEGRSNKLSIPKKYKF